MFIEGLNHNAAHVLELMRGRSIDADVPVIPGTGHLLAALMDFRSSYAGRILSHLGLDYPKIREVEKIVESATLPGDLTDPHISARVSG